MKKIKLKDYTFEQLKDKYLYVKEEVFGKSGSYICKVESLIGNEEKYCLIVRVIHNVNSSMWSRDDEVLVFDDDDISVIENESEITALVI